MWVFLYSFFYRLKIDLDDFFWSQKIKRYKFSILDVVLNNKAFTYKNTIKLKLQNFARVFLPLYVLVDSPL